MQRARHAITDGMLRKALAPATYTLDSTPSYAYDAFVIHHDSIHIPPCTTRHDGQSPTLPPQHMANDLNWLRDHLPDKFAALLPISKHSGTHPADFAT